MKRRLTRVVAIVALAICPSLLIGGCASMETTQTDQPSSATSAPEHGVTQPQAAPTPPPPVETKPVLVPADRPKEAKRPSPDGSHAPGAAAAKPGQKAAIRREAIPPALAPWPPFAPSARYTLRRDWLVKDEVNWGSVVDKVEAALTDNGYDDIRYYAVPGGFAVATRIERIHPDGSSYGADQRFVPRIDHVSPGNWTFESFIASLVGAPIGYYRCFLFVFSDQPFGYRSGVVSPEVLERWRAAGWNTLGQSLRRLRYSEEMRAEVLIYQFEQAQVGQSPTLASGVDAERQLQIANLLDHLRSQP